jgi:hypothetical protein
MKKLVLLVVVIVGGLVGFNYVTTGEIALVPGGSSTEEGRELRELEGRFTAAKRQFTQAARATALSGADMTGDAAAARSETQDVLKALGELRKRLGSESERAKADRLERDIKAYLETLR